MSRELARAHLVGPLMEGLLREIDFAQLQPGHRPRVEALCRQRLGQAATAAIRRQLGGEGAVTRLAAELAEELLCTRAFFALLQDEGVTALLAVGARRLEVERPDGREWIEGVFPSEESLERVARWMTARAGRPVHEADPRVRVRLPDGSELQAVLPPTSPGGCVLSFRRATPPLGDLCGLSLRGVIPKELVPILHALVAARVPLLVAGEGADARARVIDSLLTSANPRDRVVSIAGDGLLGAVHPAVIPLSAGSGAPDASLLDLAAGLRPDRAILPSVDATTSAPFLSLAAGPAPGSIGGLDARSPQDALDRLLAFCGGLGPQAARRLVRAGVGAILFLGRRPDGALVLEALVELALDDAGELCPRDVARFLPRPGGGGLFHGAGSAPALAERLERGGQGVPPTTWRFQRAVS